MIPETGRKPLEPGEAPNGLRTFVTIWIGQVVSLVGSGLTGFALGLWVYQRTGSAVQFTLIPAFGAAGGLLLSPLAGALVDRWDRRSAMILANLVAGARTVVVALLLLSGRLEVWHVYVAVVVRSLAEAVQYPAYGATVTVLVPGRHLVRANGMIQFGASAAQVVAPLLAGVLVVLIDVWGVLLLDLATFGVAIGTLLAVRIPKPPGAEDGSKRRPSLWRGARQGWEYIVTRPPLVRLLVLFAALNFVAGLAIVLVTPLVLSFGGAPELGIVQAVASAGALIGGVLMTVWGGPRVRMMGILLSTPLMGLGLLVAGAQPSVLWVATGLFCFTLCVPVINASNQAIWQSKVEPALQGRVFAMRRLLAQGTSPFSYLLAGLLADHLFEPSMSSPALAATVGRVIGTGPGRGMGLMLLTMGGFLLIGGLLALVRPSLRRLEEDLAERAPEPAAG